MVDQIPLLPSPLTLQSESEMIDFGRQLAQKIQPPTLIELVGDVGAGKTTITRGLALGLGITEPVTSPSFTISKQYPFPGGTLVHYDFYRLHSPGLMQDNLLECKQYHHRAVLPMRLEGSNLRAAEPPRGLAVAYFGGSVRHVRPFLRPRMPASRNTRFSWVSWW